MKFPIKTLILVVSLVYSINSYALIDGIILVGEENREYVRVRIPTHPPDNSVAIATNQETVLLPSEDICSAKMITPQFGVTASHCFYDFNEDRLKFLKGEPAVIEVVDNFSEEVIVEKAEIKKVYYYYENTSDLAVFELKKPLTSVKTFTPIASFDEMLDIFYEISGNQLKLNKKQQDLVKKHMTDLKAIGYGWCPTAKTCPFPGARTSNTNIKLLTRLDPKLNDIEKADITEMADYDSMLITVRSDVSKKEKNKNEGYVFYGDSGGPLLASGFGKDKKSFKQIAVSSFGYTADDAEVYEHEGFKVVISELFGPNLCPLLHLNKKELLPVFPEYKEGCAQVEDIDKVKVRIYTQQ